MSVVRGKLIAYYAQLSPQKRKEQMDAYRAVDTSNVLRIKDFIGDGNNNMRRRAR